MSSIWFCSVMESSVLLSMRARCGVGVSIQSIIDRSRSCMDRLSAPGWSIHYCILSTVVAFPILTLLPFWKMTHCCGVCFPDDFRLEECQRFILWKKTPFSI